MTHKFVRAEVLQLKQSGGDDLGAAEWCTATDDNPQQRHRALEHAQKLGEAAYNRVALMLHLLKGVEYKQERIAGDTQIC